MTITPTLEGGLRLDAEDSVDWLILVYITDDDACDQSLAERMANLITDTEIANDWQDFVVPDLDAQFSSARHQVATAVIAARLEAADGPGSLWISREDAPVWFSALNQARLAIEEQFHFGPSKSRLDPESLPPDRRSAYLRSHFYCAIQSLLLKNAMW